MSEISHEKRPVFKFPKTARGVDTPKAYEQVILITGSRDWKDEEMIIKALQVYKEKQTLVIHGDCYGADKLAGKSASSLGFTVVAKPADWAQYGRAAGPVRNKEMVKLSLGYKQQGIPTIVLAFHDALADSKGTKHCVSEARKVGLELVLYSH